ncbi:elongation factor 1-gamma-like protein, partial [Tanacetum coccineum]
RCKRRSFVPLAMALIMHSGPGNKNVYKALIAAEYVGVDIKMADNFQMGVSNKTPEFVKMNPMGKVPVLETPEGSVFESNAIARYVARGSSLFGSSAIEYGQIEQWIDFSSFELDGNLRGWVLPRLGYANYIKPVEESYIANTKRGLTALNTHLATHTFLVGDSVTLADIITTCNLFYGIKLLMPKSFTSEYPHVERYFWTMVNQPNFKKVTGEIKQADAVLPLPSAKKPEQPKEVKPKAEPKKVEAPKPAVEEEEEAPKPKAKNPLDLLPPSKMVLDDWKRLYSNTKSNFREVAIKGFWDMFDPEGYSLWFCTYKYNDENTVSFVTMNKVGGFLQRMDLARKYAFGKMLIIGNEPPFKVKGLWLFRGPEIPQFVMDECYDMELYEWTKVDLSDEAQKERVNQMIEDQEPFEGEALLDAKCFK